MKAAMVHEAGSPEVFMTEEMAGSCGDSPSLPTDANLLYCISLHCDKRQCIACTIIHCTTMYCTILMYSSLHCTVMQYTVLTCTVVHCTEL